MGQLAIPVEVLPPAIRTEIAGLECDFAHLPCAARQRAMRANLSAEAWDYIDGLVAERLQSLSPDMPTETGEAE